MKALFTYHGKVLERAGIRDIFFVVGHVAVGDGYRRKFEPLALVYCQNVYLFLGDSAAQPYDVVRLAREFFEVSLRSDDRPQTLFVGEEGGYAPGIYALYLPGGDPP